jgi:hypothetical protein
LIGRKKGTAGAKSALIGREKATPAAKSVFIGPEKAMRPFLLYAQVSKHRCEKAVVKISKIGKGIFQLPPSKMLRHLNVHFFTHSLLLTLAFTLGYTEKNIFSKSYLAF